VLQPFHYHLLTVFGCYTLVRSRLHYDSVAWNTDYNWRQHAWEYSAEVSSHVLQSSLFSTPWYLYESLSYIMHYMRFFLLMFIMVLNSILPCLKLLVLAFVFEMLEISRQTAVRRTEFSRKRLDMLASTVVTATWSLHGIFDCPGRDWVNMLLQVSPTSELDPATEEAMQWALHAQSAFLDMSRSTIAGHLLRHAETTTSDRTSWSIG
jgi:hypothetical protein